MLNQKPRKGSHLVSKTVCDYAHLGQVLATRHRLGPLYIWDVLDRQRGRVR